MFLLNSPWGTDLHPVSPLVKWRFPIHGGTPSYHPFYTRWCPLVINWFLNPLTIDKSPINHSYWSYLHQLNAILRAPPCRIFHEINQPAIGDPFLETPSRHDFCGAMFGSLHKLQDGAPLQIAFS